MELIDEFSTITRYMTNTQKSNVDTKIQNIIKKILLTVAIVNTKDLGINPAKYRKVYTPTEMH